MSLRALLTRRWLRAVLSAGVGASLALAMAFTSQAQSQSPTPRRSGFEDMSRATQAMQRDDASNPGMFAVQDGEALWRQPAGATGKACVACHASAASSMRGVAARYPAFDTRLARPLSLSQRINQCRQHHQQATAFRPESQDLLALETFVAFQSRNAPMAPPDDERLAPARARGQAIWQQRIGQINLSCAQCHDTQAGQKLAGSLIPQAHPTGYPIYRLEWQGMGSLQRRVRGCMSGVRAEPYAFDAQELVELESYMAVRARGMAIETPGVRP